jgi:hypothetical protein
MRSEGPGRFEVTGARVTYELDGKEFFETLHGTMRDSVSANGRPFEETDLPKECASSVRVFPHTKVHGTGT